MRAYLYVRLSDTLESFWGSGLADHNEDILIKCKQTMKQECIPVWCIPPACWPFPCMHCDQGDVPARGVYLPGGCTCLWSWGWGCLLRGCLLTGGACLWSWGGVCSRGVYPSMQWGRRPWDQRQVPSPTNRMTDRCKNITFPQTSFGGSNNLTMSTLATG